MTLLRRGWVILLLGVTPIFGQQLYVGMGEAEVEAQLGAPVNEASGGGRVIRTYAGGAKVEFREGVLYEAEGVDTSAHVPEGYVSEMADPQPEPVAAPVVEPSPAPIDAAPLESVDDDPGEEEGGSGLTEDLRNLLIGFAIDLVIHLIVLKVAFSIRGFPIVFAQNLCLSLAVAVYSALVQRYAGGFIYLDFGGGLVLLIGCIKRFTDVREWATAIQIGLISRLVAFGIAYGVALLVLMGL